VQAHRVVRIGLEVEHERQLLGRERHAAVGRHSIGALTHHRQDWVAVLVGRRELNDGGSGRSRITSRLSVSARRRGGGACGAGLGVPSAGALGGAVGGGGRDRRSAGRRCARVLFNRRVVEEAMDRVTDLVETRVDAARQRALPLVVDEALGLRGQRRVGE